MRILYVTFAAINSNTSANIRNKNLIKGFLDNNVQVDLLTIYTSPDNQYFDSDYCRLSVKNEFIINKDIINVNLKSTVDNKKKNKILKKTLLRLYHSVSIFDRSIIYLSKIKQIINQFDFAPYYDVVISSSDPKTAHVFTKKLLDQGLAYGEWIQYWGDPLALDITNKTIYPKFILKKFERKIFNGANKIIYVSPITLVEQQKNFKGFSDIMFFVPIPYYKEKLYENPKSNENTRLKISYFGDYHSNIRNIVPLYNAVSNEQNKFELSINGNSDLDLQNRENIEISQRISSEELAIKEKESDVLVCLLNRHGTQIPGKLFHYSGTNKPILVIAEGKDSAAIESYLGKYERFIICENEETSILKALEYIQNNNVLYSPLVEFNSKNIAIEFIDIYSI